MISESGSNTCLVSSDYFLLSSLMPFNFLLKTRHDISGYKNLSNEAFSVGLYVNLVRS